MDKLKTAIGKEFECDYFVTIPYPQQTYFRIKNTPIDTVAKVFSDSRETNEIVCGDYTIKNYTKLIVIIPEGDAIKVCLAKE